MPSIADLVTSPSTLDAVAAAVPGSPPPDELADDVSVELLAGSGVARVSVRAGSPELAARLAEAFAGRVAAADLLAPAGTLRVLDRQATLLEKGPDLTLGVGLGLIAGTLAGLGTAAVLVRRVRARRGDARRSVLSTLVAAGHGIVPVLSARDADAGERLLVLARAAGGPVRVAAGSPGVADAVLALQSDLAREPGTGAGGGTDESLVLVVDRAADGADLDAAVRALRPGTRRHPRDPVARPGQPAGQGQPDRPDGRARRVPHRVRAGPGHRRRRTGRCRADRAVDGRVRHRRAHRPRPRRDGRRPHDGLGRHRGAAGAGRDPRGRPDRGRDGRSRGRAAGADRRAVPAVHRGGRCADGTHAPHPAVPPPDGPRRRVRAGRHGARGVAGGGRVRRALTAGRPARRCRGAAAARDRRRGAHPSLLGHRGRRRGSALDPGRRAGRGRRGAAGEHRLPRGVPDTRPARGRRLLAGLPDRLGAVRDGVAGAGRGVVPGVRPAAPRAPRPAARRDPVRPRAARARRGALRGVRPARGADRRARRALGPGRAGAGGALRLRHRFRRPVHAAGGRPGRGPARCLPVAAARPPGAAGHRARAAGPARRGRDGVGAAGRGVAGGPARAARAAPRRGTAAGVAGAADRGRTARGARRGRARRSRRPRRGGRRPGLGARAAGGRHRRRRDGGRGRRGDERRPAARPARRTARRPGRRGPPDRPGGGVMLAPAHRLNAFVEWPAEPLHVGDTPVYVDFTTSVLDRDRLLAGGAASEIDRGHGALAALRRNLRRVTNPDGGTLRRRRAPHPLRRRRRARRGGAGRAGARPRPGPRRRRDPPGAAPGRSRLRRDAVPAAGPRGPLRLHPVHRVRSPLAVPRLRPRRVRSGRRARCAADLDDRRRRDRPDPLPGRRACGAPGAVLAAPAGPGHPRAVPVRRRLRRLVPGRALGHPAAPVGDARRVPGRPVTPAGPPRVALVLTQDRGGPVEVCLALARELHRTGAATAARCSAGSRTGDRTWCTPTTAAPASSSRRRRGGGAGRGCCRPTTGSPRTSARRGSAAPPGHPPRRATPRDARRGRRRRAGAGPHRGLRRTDAPLPVRAAAAARTAPRAHRQRPGPRPVRPARRAGAPPPHGRAPAAPQGDHRPDRRAGAARGVPRRRDPHRRRRRPRAPRDRGPRGRLGRRIRLLGFRADVPELMRAADAVAVPSRMEQQPLVVIEAMAAGKPVLATDTGDTATMLAAPGAARFIAAPGEPESLATALRALFADPDPGLTGTLLAARAAERYSAPASARSHLALYRSLLGRPGRDGRLSPVRDGHLGVVGGGVERHPAAGEPAGPHAGAAVADRGPARRAQVERPVARPLGTGVVGGRRRRPAGAGAAEQGGPGEPGPLRRAGPGLGPPGGRGDQQGQVLRRGGEHLVPLVALPGGQRAVVAVLGEVLLHRPAEARVPGPPAGEQPRLGQVRHEHLAPLGERGPGPGHQRVEPVAQQGVGGGGVGGPGDHGVGVEAQRGHVVVGEHAVPAVADGLGDDAVGPGPLVALVPHGHLPVLWVGRPFDAPARGVGGEPGRVGGGAVDTGRQEPAVQPDLGVAAGGRQVLVDEQRDPRVLGAQPPCDVGLPGVEDDHAVAPRRVADLLHERDEDAAVTHSPDHAKIRDPGPGWRRERDDGAGGRDGCVERDRCRVRPGAGPPRGPGAAGGARRGAARRRGRGGAGVADTRRGPGDRCRSGRHRGGDGRGPGRPAGQQRRDDGPGHPVRARRPRHRRPGRAEPHRGGAAVADRAHPDAAPWPGRDRHGVQLGGGAPDGGHPGLLGDEGRGRGARRGTAARGGAARGAGDRGAAGVHPDPVPRPARRGRVLGPGVAVGDPEQVASAALDANDRDTAVVEVPDTRLRDAAGRVLGPVKRMLGGRRCDDLARGAADRAAGREGATGGRRDDRARRCTALPAEPLPRRPRLLLPHLRRRRGAGVGNHPRRLRPGQPVPLRARGAARAARPQPRRRGQDHPGGARRGAPRRRRRAAGVADAGPPRRRPARRPRPGLDPGAAPDARRVPGGRRGRRRLLRHRPRARPDPGRLGALGGPGPRCRLADAAVGHQRAGPGRAVLGGLPAHPRRRAGRGPGPARRGGPVTACRFCAGADGEVVLDLGVQPDCKTFPPAADPGPDAVFPLRMWLCDACGLAQLAEDPGGIEEVVGLEPAALVEQGRAAVAALAAAGVVGPGVGFTEYGSPHGGSWVADLTATGATPVAPGERADVVVDNLGLMHDADQAAALRERADRLRPGGTLVVGFHTLRAIVDGAQWNDLRHGHFAYYSTPALAGMLETVGLTAVRAWWFPLYGGTVLLTARAGARRRTPGVGLQRGVAGGGTAVAGRDRTGPADRDRRRLGGQAGQAHPGDGHPDRRPGRARRGGAAVGAAVRRRPAPGGAARAAAGGGGRRHVAAPRRGPGPGVTRGRHRTRERPRLTGGGGGVRGTSPGGPSGDGAQGSAAPQQGRGETGGATGRAAGGRAGAGVEGAAGGAADPAVGAGAVVVVGVALVPAAAQVDRDRGGRDGRQRAVLGGAARCRDGDRGGGGVDGGGGVGRDAHGFLLGPRRPCGRSAPGFAWSVRTISERAVGSPHLMTPHSPLTALCAS
ncbi:hypothetical protein L7F22_049427 [Adiantum nelumboides]|nr:hypothetical protein [Adiantum nelumboides]